MATYRYTAKTPGGAETAGVIDAASVDEALDVALGRGLRDVQVTRLRDDQARVDPDPRDQTSSLPAEPVVVATAVGQPPVTLPGGPVTLSGGPVTLSGGEAHELARQVAQISMAKVPLAAGLRAAAEETDNQRVARALLWIADQADQGRSLEETLTHSGKLLPTYVSGLILAALRTGTLGEALFDLVEQQQSLQGIRRGIFDGLVYPLIVLMMAVAVLLLAGYFATEFVGDTMKGFGLRLPMATQLLLWWRETGWRFLGPAILGFLFVAAMYRLIAGRARWQHLLSTLPLFGAMWQSTAVAEWSGLLSVLLKHQIPLPEALRLAGHGMENSHLGGISLRLADGVARGRLLSQMMVTFRAIPASLIPLVEWGEQSGTLSESFHVGREMFEKRVSTRAALINFLVPPLLFLWIGCTVLFVVVATFGPMVSLMTMLS
ncbi:MAG: type II secretion system F family protein [Pirellulaceae bacterium]